MTKKVVLKQLFCHCLSIYCIDVQGNTTISTSTSNFGSSGRVDGPLLETRSLLTCHQPRGSQARINKVYSVKKDAFPQHNISNAEYKEILTIIYKYKYTFGLAVVGG